MGRFDLTPDKTGVGEKAMKASKVRPAVQTGRFYPDDREELRSTVRSLLDKAPRAELGACPRGLMAPHAGYIFSGATAACAYRQIEGMEAQRVIVAGPSHHAHFPGGSIYDGRAFETPLGQVEVDVDLAEALRAQAPIFRHAPQAHAPEHSIEVQLPFLQMTLKGFRLLPILISDQGEENCLALAEALLGVLESRPPVSTLFVASSDLYHGYDYEECGVQDHRFEQALLSFEPRRLLREALAGGCMACGAGPVAAVMELSRQVGATQAQILRRTNSRDAQPMAGSSYIVGYAAAVFV